MNKFKSFLFTLMIIMTGPGVAAQPVEMADKFRGEGKIYVVVMIALLLLISIFFYLFRIDRKLKKLEENQNSEQ